MPQRQITAMVRMELPATLDNLTPLIQFVSTCAAEKGFSKKKLQIELATEEALVNIFNYAYPDHKGDVEVRRLPSILLTQAFPSILFPSTILTSPAIYRAAKSGGSEYS
jgi:hypothetical protein